MTTSRMPEAGAARPGEHRRPAGGDVVADRRPPAESPAGSRRRARALAAGGAAALALLLGACASPGGAPAPSAGRPASASTSAGGAWTAAPGPGAAASLAEAPASSPPGTSIVGATSDDGGAVRLTVVVDGAHSWITAKADLAGASLDGACDFLLERGAQGGERVAAQTARILSTREGTRCNGVSFPVGEPGEYRVTVSVPGVAGRPLSVSTAVDYPGAG